jgi:uncharacterized SAM-binding protein YcdF (DUF218 family)
MFASLCWLLARRQWKSAIWLGSTTFVIFLFGSTPLVEAIVSAAESQSVAGSLMEVPRGDAVVVLGGGYYVSDKDPHGFALSEGGTRILAALELLRREKAPALVLGGGLPVPGQPGLSAPALLEKWVVSSGLARTAEVITNLGVCRNTYEEAVQFRKLQSVYGWRKVLLVTSALHMPRSLALFKKQGIEAEPVVCDFKVYGVPGARFPLSPFPRQRRFEILGLYLHEKIGWWVYRMRGWI